MLQLGRWQLGMVLLTCLFAAPGAAGAEAAQADDRRAASDASSTASGDGGDDAKQDEHHGDEHGESEGHAEGEHAEDGHGEEAHGAEHEDGDHHGGGHGSGHGHGSRLSDEAIPLQLEGFPERPKPLVELGEPFLGTGTLDPGFRLPTGAVWQPSLLAFGTLRSAVQSFERIDDERITELTARLDLFLNLQLSGSERLVVGIRALDQDGRFSSFFLEHPDPELDGDFREELNADIETFFFEGDFGEIFPNLDRDDFGSLDLGFSIGRQPMLFQEGLLINDTIDGIGLTRNTLLPQNTSNFRATTFVGWGNIDAGTIERKGQLIGLLTSTDTRRSTLDVDVVYLRADDAFGDMLTAGISAVQRIGSTNTAFRLLHSRALDDETALSTDGTLLFSELSWTPHGTHDLVYFNSFWAIDQFSAAARGPAVGGPLGRAGINFAAVGLGSFGAPLSSQAFDVAGAAIGYQRFFDHTRKQLLVEAGGRFGTASTVDDAFAATVRWQAAFKRRFVLVLDAFGSRRETATDDLTSYGGRIEWVVKF